MPPGALVPKEQHIGFWRLNGLQTQIREPVCSGARVQWVKKRLQESPAFWPEERISGRGGTRTHDLTDVNRAL
jgi:hypothetical protein